MIWQVLVIAKTPANMEDPWFGTQWTFSESARERSGLPSEILCAKARGLSGGLFEGKRQFQNIPDEFLKTAGQCSQSINRVLRNCRKTMKNQGFKACNLGRHGKNTWPTGLVFFFFARLLICQARVKARPTPRCFDVSA